ncbi:hypothetical protein SK128_021768, partial [Halocaridina rubra]
DAPPPAAIPCSGRDTPGRNDFASLKKILSKRSLSDSFNTDTDLHSPHSMPVPSSSSSSSSAEYDGKLFFTIWSTQTSTFTLTSFSTDRATTISANLLCIYDPAKANVNLC